MVTRESIVLAVRRAVEPQPWALALWEGGSASFHRADAWSDVDIGMGVEDAHVEDAFAAVESALDEHAGLASRWIENPPAHAKPQRYYRLRDADPWLLVDFGALRRSTPPLERFVDRRRHGQPRVLFDRIGFTDDVPPDRDAWRERLRGRVTYLRGRFEHIGPLALKSARRGELAEAVAFYQAFVLNPLVEALRIAHDPWRHDFGVRYIRFDLPEPVRERVYALWFVKDVDDLVAKHAQASAWLAEELERLDVDRVELP